MSERGEVLVTGAFGGLGTAMTVALLEAGYRVVACDRRGDDAEAWMGSLGVDHERLTTHPLDVTREDEIEALAGALADEGRHIAYLVNNAGVQGPGNISTFDSKRFDTVMRVNLYGTFYMTKAFSGAMVERRFGRIVNISSINAYEEARNQAAYAAAKAGILGFTRSVALDLAPHGITVNAVAPGLIWHDALGAVMSERARDDWVVRIPAGASGTPDHIAAAVRYLFSDGAAYHTGQVLHVNGGLYLGG